MIPAAGLILYADYSKYPDVFKVLGWFMLGTSLMLYIIPRRLHYGYSHKWSVLIKPLYFQLISPFSFLFGGALIYGVM
ncbi:hypothetical protein [Hymenobacter saemangeumensis]